MDRFKQAFSNKLFLLLGVVFVLGACSSPSGSDSGGNEEGNEEEQQSQLFAGGSGTVGDPYQIETLAHLDSLSSFSNDVQRLGADSIEHFMKAHYELIADIDASELDNNEGFQPIGYYKADKNFHKLFRGSLDGNGHVISNIAINYTYESEEPYLVGVFRFADEAEFRDLNIEKLQINTSVEEEYDFSSIQVGGLVGNSQNTRIENVSVSGKIVADSSVVAGGIAGSNDGTIVDSDVDIDISEGTPRHSSIGGIVGQNRDGGVIENCVATVEMNGQGFDIDVGGVAGINQEGGLITTSSSKGFVKGTNRVGGLVGINLGIISDSNSEATVEGESSIGGLVGRNESEITNSSASGTVSGSRGGIGGLVGFHNSGSFLDVQASGDVSGKNNIGGLVGGSSAPIEDAVATGKVEGESYIGGLIGRANSTVQNSSSQGQVIGTDRRVGGLVGHLQDLTEGESGGEIRQSRTESDVTGKAFVGGLVGTNRGSTIKNSYATGDVDGTNKVGGLVGKNYREGKISKSFATGLVSVQKDEVGGVVGNLDVGSVTDTYWDTNTTSQDNGTGFEDGTVTNMQGLSTSQMTGSSAAENMQSLDFNSIWTTTSDYPELTWQQK